MENDVRTSLKKAANGLGFMLFAVVGVMYALVLSVYFAVPNLGRTGTNLLNIFASVAGMFLVGLFYCLFSKTDINSTIPFSRVKFGRLMAMIAVGITVAIAADYITELLSYNLKTVGMHNNVDLETHASTPLDNVLSVLSVAVIPPLSEEFLFRGILLGRLRRFGNGFAIIFSSALFALMHMNIVQIPFAFVVGLVMAFMTVKANSLLPAILIHFANNFRSVLINLISDSKVMDEALLNIIYIIFIILVFCAGIFSAVILSKDKNIFKIKYENEIHFGDALAASVCTGGMITYIAVCLLLTATTVGFG